MNSAQISNSARLWFELLKDDMFKVNHQDTIIERIVLGYLALIQEHH